MTEAEQKVFDKIEECRSQLQKELWKTKIEFVKPPFWPAARPPLDVLTKVAKIKGQLAALDEIEIEFYDGELRNEV